MTRKYLNLQSKHIISVLNINVKHLNKVFEQKNRSDALSNVATFVLEVKG